MISANLLLSRPFIKINACLIGYGLWILFSQHQIITTSLQTPLYFYNTPHDTYITAPDTINVILQAPKNILHQSDAYNTAMYLDASHLKLGNNHIVMQKENLFLPDTINLINLKPSYLQIQLQKVEEVL